MFSATVNVGRVSAIDRVESFLLEGNSISAAQARSRFGVRNLRALISDLRTERGWEFSRSTNTRGATTYRITNG